MAEWWDARLDERYWCEVTDRRDIGANLWCPQTDESGQPYWSYTLIHSIAPGDIVFHYSTRQKAFAGASVAGGPVEERSIIWVPHGTVGRSRKESRVPRPGWWRPLYSFIAASQPLTLRELNLQENQAWLRSWVEQRHLSGPPRLPVQLYPKNLRGAQGYLTKMPRDFVNRWSELSSLEAELAETQERLAPMAEWYSRNSQTEPGGSEPSAGFRPKSAEDYLAFIRGGIQRRTRNHERLVESVGKELRDRGATITNPHPLDLLMTAPLSLIFEAKIVGRFGPILAVRSAVGQLFEYRSFVGPRDAYLCILLDENPGEALVRYVEEDLRWLILWLTDSGLVGGSQTATKLSALKISTV